MIASKEIDFLGFKIPLDDDEDGPPPEFDEIEKAEKFPRINYLDREVYSESQMLAEPGQECIIVNFSESPQLLIERAQLEFAP